MKYLKTYIQNILTESFISSTQSTIEGRIRDTEEKSLNIKNATEALSQTTRVSVKLLKTWYLLWIRW